MAGLAPAIIFSTGPACAEFRGPIHLCAKIKQLNNKIQKEKSSRVLADSAITRHGGFAVVKMRRWNRRTKALMSHAAIDFDAPDLAARIENSSQSDLDNLPFGVILLDREGIVRFYSATEARLSGYGHAPLGRNLFDVSSCANREVLRERIMRAIEEGSADLEFAWFGDPTDPRREMRIRVQSARSGGVWLCIERD